MSVTRGHGRVLRHPESDPFDHRRQGQVQAGRSHLRSYSCSPENQAGHAAASLSCCLPALVLRLPGCSPASSCSRLYGGGPIDSPRGFVRAGCLVVTHSRAYWLTGLRGWWSRVLPIRKRHSQLFCSEAWWRVLLSSCSCPSISFWAGSAPSRPAWLGVPDHFS